MKLNNIPFNIHKCSGTPKITYEDEFAILDYLYNYMVLNNEFDTPISKHEFLKVTILNITNNNNETVNCQYLTIRSEFGILNLNVVIITSSRAVILVQSSVQAILLQYLQKLAEALVLPGQININRVLHHTILGIKDQSIPSEQSTEEINPEEIKQTIANVIGNIELVYAINNSHLNTISLNITKPDLRQLLTNFEFDTNLYEFMNKHTGLNFNKLKLQKMFANGMYLSQSRVKVGEMSESHQSVLLENIWRVCY